MFICNKTLKIEPQQMKIVFKYGSLSLRVLLLRTLSIKTKETKWVDEYWSLSVLIYLLQRLLIQPLPNKKKGKYVHLTQYSKSRSFGLWYQQFLSFLYLLNLYIFSKYKYIYRKPDQLKLKCKSRCVKKMKSNFNICSKKVTIYSYVKITN